MNKTAERLILVTVVIAITSPLIAYGADYPAEWQSMDITALSGVATPYNAQGDAGKTNRELMAAYVSERYTAAKARLASHVTDTLLASKTATRSIKSGSMGWGVA